MSEEYTRLDNGIIKILLGESLYDCPIWWQNFIKSLFGDEGNSCDGLLEEEMKSYNCYWFNTEGIRVDNSYAIRVAGIEFDNERDFFVFKIKFS